MPRFSTFPAAFALLLATLLFSPLAEARSSDMPQFKNEVITTAIGPNVEKTVHDAIIKGAKVKGWTVALDTPRKLRLKLTVRNKHTIIVHVAINLDSVDVDYVSSNNMNYAKDADGREVIHPYYGKWITLMLEAARAAAANDRN
jgi:hypothetical protein